MSNKDWYLAKGHTPRMTDDFGEPKIDMFFCDSELHNGPGCDTCYWSCCEHCKSDRDKIPVCTKLKEWG